jgi:hypothetical protein
MDEAPQRALILLRCHWRVLTSEQDALTSRSPVRRRLQPESPPDGRSGGVGGNERLTATTAVVLVVLLAALGITILSIGPLIWWHVLLGMLLIPPVVLKLGSTGWRFLRYYARSPEYVRRGPPLLPLRLLAPLVIAATLAVFATGVALLVVGPAGGVLVGLHKASFVVWLVVTGIHVLAHVRSIPKLAAADWRPRPVQRERHVSGTAWRRLLLAGSIVVGAILAIATVRYAQPWVHFFASRGADG